MLSPIRWEDGALALLDQRRLPAEEAWLRCEKPEQVAEAISGMAVRGAPAIGIAAAYGVALAVRDTADPAAARRRFEEAFDLLAATRPTAANLGWALERASLALERALDRAEPAAEALLTLAHDLEESQLAADRRLARLGAELLSEGDRVLTHCNTGALATGGYGTAGGVIQAAFEFGRLRSVWVNETRPLLQGSRLTAWELQRAGIPFRVVTEASLGALMGRGLVDRVLVGADRIAANGDVANKIGTYPIAVLAERHGVPFYVAAPRSTIDPGAASGEAIPIEERDPREVTSVLDRAVAPPGTVAVNWAFDVTPHALVKAIVTEVGVLEPPYGESIASALAT
jgi:methylthioribose-1-phosphate isomerase